MLSSLPSWSAASLLLLGGLAPTAHAAVDKINAVGSKFFYENGTQYYMKGTDPLQILHRTRLLTGVRNCLPTRPR